MGSLSYKYSWNFLPALGFSLFISVIITVTDLVAKLFYPPHVDWGIVYSPFFAAASGQWAPLVICLIVYGGFISYNLPRSRRIREENEVGDVAVYTAVSLLFLSGLIDLSYTYPLNTRVGIFLVVNVLSALVGTLLAVKFRPWNRGQRF
ncbi:hypothetical protein HS1genome_2107 [Sulfodiicoccus acidiphilus]|uniref:Uncharacterized protein n=1 Tax=Sulfodiicoccus acidiphilus TaxID=1670455 RepID=A0A348B6B6_9CREN|nr:hypothetical protein [Sulfodiicoccus acidiphilus]BBD73718.1 hypothetical protein HS1genome_2107 [Sulfodiicoccus acidiphilus]GGT97848.1 hypothetical protein GCM10007116_14240 [Sulfodiicoccus acidiphilus]